MVEGLCADPNNFVFIISGRARTELSQWFDPSVRPSCMHGVIQIMPGYTEDVLPQTVLNRATSLFIAHTDCLYQYACFAAILCGYLHPAQIKKPCFSPGLSVGRAYDL